MPATKPYPSLSFCFRNNVDACCLTAHDEMIKSNYGNFMPSACSSQFVYFEQLQCIGCHLTEPQVVDKANKEVRLCHKFAENLYFEDPEDMKPEDKDLNDITTKYDTCGFMHTTPTKYIMKNDKEHKLDQWGKRQVIEES